MATRDKADEVVVKDVLYGNINSFKIIIDRYQKHIFSMGMRFLKNEEDAYDFVQEVFVKTYEKLASYKGLSPFRYWLIKIAYNHAINKIKVNKPNQIITSEILEKNTPEIIHIKNEAKEALLKAIEKLPQQYQMCLDLYFFLGFTYNEISEITKIPINTIKSHVLRSKQILRETLRGTAAEEYCNEM